MIWLNQNYKIVLRYSVAISPLLSWGGNAIFLLQNPIYSTFVFRQGASVAEKWMFEICFQFHSLKLRRQNMFINLFWLEFYSFYFILGLF